jgi:hypothetical protein
MGNPIDNRKLDKLTSQKSQRPPRPTFGRLSARRRNQPCLASAIELSPPRRLIRVFPIQRLIQTLFDESLPDVRHRVCAHFKRIRRLLIRPVWTVSIHLQQHLRVSDLPSARSTL